VEGEKTGGLCFLFWGEKVVDGKRKTLDGKTKKFKQKKRNNVPYFGKSGNELPVGQ